MRYYKSALTGVLLFLQINSAFTEVDCGEPPDILNTYRVVNVSTSNRATTEGSVWYYQCIERFQNVTGDAFRICNSSGFWEGNDIECEAVSCAPLKRPDHGAVMFLSLDVGSQATYFCFQGYKLGIGDFNRTCLPDGTYSGSPPECDIIKCPEPQYIENSFMNKETNEYNTWVIYTCFPGYYKTLGDLERRCTAGGVWSGDQPYCAEIYCPFPTKPLRSTPEFTSIKWKGTLSYTCDYGTSLASGNLTRHCSDDATWDGEEPVCEEIRCSTPPEVANATTKHDAPISNYGTIIYYSCNHGYLNNGGKIYSECGREGEWSEVDLDCVGVYCGKAPLFIGAKNNASGEMYNDIAIYECFIQLDDHIKTWIKTCNRYGVWTGKEPECTDGWYDKKFEPEPVEAPGSVGIGITVFAIFVTLIICIIILDVATLKPHFVYLRRNLKDFRKTVRKQYRILKAHPKFIDFTYKIRMKKWDEKRLTKIRPESSAPSVLGEVTD